MPPCIRPKARWHPPQCYSREGFQARRGPVDTRPKRLRPRPLCSPVAAGAGARPWAAAAWLESAAKVWVCSCRFFYICSNIVHLIIHHLLHMNPVSVKSYSPFTGSSSRRAVLPGEWHEEPCRTSSCPVRPAVYGLQWMRQVYSPPPTYCASISPSGGSRRGGLAATTRRGCIVT